MNEKILNNKKNGMAVLLGTLLTLIVSIAGFIFGCILADAGQEAMGVVLIIVGTLVFIVCCVMFGGLKSLKPQ